MNEINRWLATPGRRFAAFALALALLRIAALVASDADLGPDEGQYWFWSRAPDAGYFSKPPLIAWSIAATTAVFGSAEWAVRLSAPLYQLGAGVFLFLLSRRLADARTAFWAGAAWLTLPGVFLSSALITTDAPLTFFWAAALYFFFVLTDTAAPHRPRLIAILLGAAIGLGFLSKYAMTFFILGAALALALSPARRRALGPLNASIAAAVALIVISPNLLWNAAHEFQTISHTAANANWTGDFGHPGRLLKFLADQIGVAGPIMLVLILVAAFSRGNGLPEAEKERRRALLAFSIPVFAIVSAQAFISRAHGNWAATAYPSAVVLATLFAMSKPRWAFAAKASVALHLVIGLGFLAAFASRDVADSVGAAPAFYKVRGWEAPGAAIARISLPYDAIMTDDREVMGELVYYARKGKPVFIWNSNPKVESHFEAFNGFDPERHGRVLYVSLRDDALYIQNQFSTIAPLRSLEADLGGGRARTLYLYEVSGRTEPNPNDAARE